MPRSLARTKSTLARRDRETCAHCGAVGQAEIAKCFVRESYFAGFEQVIAADVEDAGDFALYPGLAIDAEDACPVKRVQAQVSIADSALVNDDHVFAHRVER